jgi:hypothetical protein
MKLAYAAVIALVAAGSASLIGQSGPRRDGNWEITMEMQMPNMPNMPQGMSMPPIKTTQCITKEEAADPTKGLPSAPQRAGGPPSDCKMTDQKIEGNKVSWAMTCTGATAMSGTGEVVYAGDTFTGNMVMNMARGGQANTMTMKYSGKRLGDCNK